MQELSPQERQRALDRALRSLAARAHTEKEISDKLSRAGFSEAAVASVMETLTQYRLVDDVSFAEGFVSARAKRGVGPYRLRQELRRKGVSGDDAQTALSAVSDEDMLSAAAAFAKRRLRDGSPDDRRRVMQALVRRGYGYETARSALETALGKELDDCEE